MKILCFSNKAKTENKLGWFRTGENINYYQNEFKRETPGKVMKTFYTLTFNMMFEHDND